MKILTKKKQEKILELLIESGIAVAKDMEAKTNTYNRVNGNNYAIVRMLFGEHSLFRYYGAIDSALKMELVKMGEK